ncbi:MAG: helix-turn-helix transcriptional regulator [Acidimicrobiales bacterium]|nr:helix-turn-helix transcriptional regulator [Acidimicrobiales bacterium]
MAETTSENGLGQAIAVQRVHLGMKRKDLADASDLSYPYISEIENGAKQPSAKAMRKIADALQMSVADLHARAEGYSDVSSTVVRAAMMPPTDSPMSFATSVPAIDPPLPDGLTQPLAALGERPEWEELASAVREAVRSELDQWAREELPQMVRRELKRALAEIAAPGEVPS